MIMNFSDSQLLDALQTHFGFTSFRVTRGGGGLISNCFFSQDYKIDRIENLVDEKKLSC